MNGKYAVNDNIYESMVQTRGSAYRNDQIKPWSHYRESIDNRPGRLAGRSRAWGDASPDVQSRVIDALIESSSRSGLTPRETAHVLAIARVESGFNPDAAAGTTSASGLGQFIDQTGRHYGLGSQNRFDHQAQSNALVSHFIDNRNLARARGQGEEYIYKYHHDGPTRDYGGLGLSNSKVMPMLEQYEQFVRQRLERQQDDHLRQRYDANTQPDGGEQQPARREQTWVLQERLNRLGYRDASGNELSVDGRSGAKTREAVMAFQYVNGLKVDGVAGPQTLNALSKTTNTLLLSDPSHPNNVMYQQAVKGLEQLGPRTFRNRQELENAAGTLVFDARVSGLTRIDHVVASTQGTGLFAVQGQMHDPAHHRVYVDKEQAVSQPLEQSTRQLQQENLDQTFRQEQEREQRRVMTI